MWGHLAGLTATVFEAKCRKNKWWWQSAYYWYSACFGTTIWPNTNTLFGLLFELNRIRIEYLVQPYWICLHVFTPVLQSSVKLTWRCRPGYKLPAWKCARNIYREQGIRGFYKGITASYYGVSETVVHLVIYEKMKAHFRSGKDWESDAELVTAWSFVQYMAAAALSKATASCLCYPHGMLWL